MKLRTTVKVILVLLMMAGLIVSIAGGITSGVEMVISMMGAAWCTLFLRSKVNIRPPSWLLLLFMILAAAAGWILTPLVFMLIINLLMSVIGVFAWLALPGLLLLLAFMAADQGVAAMQRSRDLVETGTHRALSAEERYELQQAVTHGNVPGEVLHSGQGERVMAENKIKR